MAGHHVRSQQERQECGREGKLSAPRQWVRRKKFYSEAIDLEAASAWTEAHK